MEYKYSPNGVCATEMIFDIEDGIVKDLKIVNGCEGNHNGIARLIKGMKLEEVIQKLEGVTCKTRATSCPDQIAQALKTIVK